jgi:hypothetical protein
MKSITLKHVMLLSAVALLAACNQNYKLDSSGGSSQLSSSSVPEIPSGSSSGPNGSCVSDVCTPPSGGNGGSNPSGSDDNPPPTSDSSSVVECDMASSSDKITVSSGKFVVSHSNAASDRVCMSPHACLEIINAFANAHSGSLDSSQPSSGSHHQCTDPFPGSQGTCNNATVLSDSQVAAILLNQ